MIKKDYVYVSAFLKGNLGDDLFLKVLFDMFPSVKFKILAEKNYAYQFLHYSNVKLINYGRIKKLLNRLFAKLFNLNIFEFFLIKNSKVDLRIAGSIFIEQPGWKKKLIFRRGLYLITR